MYARDRLMNVTLLLAALAAWSAVAWVGTTVSPAGDARVQAAGAVLLGAAAALTAMPLFWMAAFARRRRIAYRGDWTRAARRAALVGGVVMSFVLLRILGAFSLPLAAFIVVMAVFVEFILTARR